MFKYLATLNQLLWWQLDLSSPPLFQRDKCPQAPQTAPPPFQEAWLHWGSRIFHPAGKFQVWATSCSLPTLPGPPPSYHWLWEPVPTSQGPQPLLWSAPLGQWGFCCRKSLQVCPLSKAAQIQGSPLTLLLLKPSSGRPGLRSRPGPCLTPALGLRREHSSKKDADPSGLWCQQNRLTGQTVGLGKPKSPRA